MRIAPRRRPSWGRTGARGAAGGSGASGELHRDVDDHVLLTAHVAGAADLLEDAVGGHAVALGRALGVDEERRVVEKADEFNTVLADWFAARGLGS